MASEKNRRRHEAQASVMVEPATLSQDQPSFTNISISSKRVHPSSYQIPHHLIRQCSQGRQHDLRGIGAQFETSLDDFRQTLSADLPPFLGLTSDCPYHSQLLQSDLQGEGTSALSQGKDAATYQSDDQCHVTKQGCWCRYSL
ncbi:hypothetical protein BOTNAR_0005g00360 [Botryotinia narcissicola]|uniref:Uncharacterized protein n=1 Tax=Botryotinia narcissicola TaxID=278944 RepID=A0A4Z1J9S3_9HELO|nr:hypothetical protein BOTNAR_0005g00360 [Botryotinia narcissicola]